MNATARMRAYGLAWNPFTAGIPTSAALVDSQLERFLWQMDELVLEGGFALITGDNGSGKSVALRLLRESLEKTRDNVVVTLARPQSSVADFYRELGASFGTPIGASNRWGGFNALREKWRAKLDATSARPVVLIDEAQDMNAAVLAEIRSLTSDRLDSRHLLTVVLCGDERLFASLDTRDLRPIASRVRVRLTRASLDPSAAEDALAHAMKEAGNSDLFSAGVVAKLAEHSLGNWRALMNASSELLQHALRREAPTPIGEQLFFDVHGGAGREGTRRAGTSRRG